MNKRIFHRSLNFLIAAVWIINGLFAKVLGYLPRHEQIVARILGDQFSGFFITAIGVAEIFMAIWIVSRIKSRLNAATQIFIVILMNVIELIVVPDLLLFGRANIIIALIFVAIVYYNEFVWQQNLEK